MWTPAKRNVRVVVAKKVHPLLQVHWHWGVDESHGSEHRLDDENYAMEVRT